MWDRDGLWATDNEDMALDWALDWALCALAVPPVASSGARSSHKGVQRREGDRAHLSAYNAVFLSLPNAERFNTAPRAVMLW